MSVYRSKTDGETTENNINYTPEYYQFIKDLREFHTKRGTLSSFDPEPKQGARILDLLEFYNLVLKNGGYDKVTDKKLHWRNLAVELQLGSHNPNAHAFQLKSCYYRNLAAYEIKTYWNEEPPPKEILEGVTARGGKLRTRTLENYIHKKRNVANTGEDDEGSDEEGTPARDHTTEDVPESAARSGRSLRQQPPQRVLFQPDTTPARQMRQHAATASPAPAINLPPKGVSLSFNPPNSEYQSSHMSKYEPKIPVALTLKQVMTPAYDPVQFERRAKAALTQAEKAAAGPNIMLPGTGFGGPNIYNRCLMALKAPIIEEQMYALYHLAKISMERGEKYMFEYFPSLPNALINICLDITSIFYGTLWEISYDYETCSDDAMLNGLDGTPDILDRIKRVTIRIDDDSIQTELFCQRMLNITQALLVIRNLVITPDNTRFVSRMPELKDLIVIILQLPQLTTLVELKHYCLDICEEITKYLALESDDPLYQTLLQQLTSEDRGVILSSLRAVNTLSMYLETPNSLQNIPAAIIQNVTNWLLLDDAELVQVCLDFFYQFVAFPANIDILFNQHSLPSLARRCCQLLSYGSVEVTEEIVVKKGVRKPVPEEPPAMPQELLDQILSFDEPERSSLWLRCLFEEDKEEYITQILLWQAYQSRFAQWATENVPSRPLLPAADFIKNVSTTFADKANAQVQHLPTGDKFVIRGIRMRNSTVNLAGMEYTKCEWQVTSHVTGQTRDCGQMLMGREQLGHHIMQEHIGAERTIEDGRTKYVGNDTTTACLWNGCTKYPDAIQLPAPVLARHIQLHLPNATPLVVRSPGEDSRSNSPSVISNGPQTTRKHPDWYTPDITTSKTYRDSVVNKDGQVGPIPINAYYVLKTLARQLPRTEAEESSKAAYQKAKEVDPDLEYVDLLDTIFKPIMPQLWSEFAVNRTMKTQLADLCATVARPKR